MNEYVNESVGTSRPHKFCAEVVVIDWVKFGLEGPILLDSHSIHLPLLLKDNVTQCLSLPYTHIAKISYPCPPSYDGCFLMELDTDPRYFNTLIGMKDKSKSVSVLIVTGYSWYDNISTVGFTLQWLVDNCRSTHKLHPDPSSFLVKIMTRKETDIALSSFQMNVQLAVGNMGYRRFCLAKEKNSNQIFRPIKKRVGKRRLGVMRSKIQRNESLISKALTSLLKSTVKRINGYLFPSGFTNYLMNTARACSNLKEIACHVRAMYPILIKQISNRDYWKKVVYFFPLVNGPQIRLLIWTYPANCFFRCDQAKKSRMVLITPKFQNQQLNTSFPIAPLEAVMYGYFALDSAHAHIGTPPSLDGISWVKMCFINLINYSETAILDSIIKLLNESISDQQNVNEMVESLPGRVYQSNGKDITDTLHDITLNMTPVYDEICSANESFFRNNWNKKVKKIETKDVRKEVIYNMFIQSCHPYDVQFDEKLFESRRVPIFQGKEDEGCIDLYSIPWPVYRRLLELTRSTARSRLMFASKRLFKDVNSIHGFCVRDLKLQTRSLMTSSMEYMKMTVNSGNIDFLTKFIHTGVVNVRIFLDSASFNDLSTLFRVLYYVRNLQLIITKSAPGNEEICLDDVKSFLLWWKNYFPKNMGKFTKVAAVQFGEYQLFNSSMSNLKCVVTACSIQGSRVTYEDRIDVRARILGDNSFLYCGVYDGHGGSEAASMAQKFMLDSLEKQENFLSKNDEKSIEAIKKGFLVMDEKMKKCSSFWGRGKSGVPSAGTTVSCIIISDGKAYVSYVGDSPMYMLKRTKTIGNSSTNVPAFSVELVGVPHTARYMDDYERIELAGGEIVNPDGEAAVRPKKALKEGSMEGKYLRMTRALGDFWMINPDFGMKIVSPEPEVFVFDIEKEDISCFLLTTDGLMISKKMLGKYILEARRMKYHVTQYLVRRMCSETLSKLDNISAISIDFLDMKEQYPPRADIVEFDCPDLKIYNFNGFLTEEPGRGITFANGRAFSTRTTSVKMDGVVSMKKDKHEQPGFVIPGSKI
ncbi:hypothetical protein FO519_002823 [Halicephalobus sp. NKZ332]|nr:hypothetical protein FO519_002823 [Halicephalobus sp. NKZ332]